MGEGSLFCCSLDTKGCKASGLVNNGSGSPTSTIPTLLLLVVSRSSMLLRMVLFYGTGGVVLQAASFMHKSVAAGRFSAMPIAALDFNWVGVVL